MSNHQNITLLKGENFSGRTHYLKTITGFHEDDALSENGVYIGPVPANYLSGLAMTVKDEMRLHYGSASMDRVFKQIISTFDLDYLLTSNPFTLSGGEQAMVAIVNAIFLQPQKLALDILLEQINHQWKDPLLNKLSSASFGDIRLFVADNRFDEFNISALDYKLPDNPEPEKFDPIYRFGKIDSKAFSTDCYKKKSVSITLQNLSYAYKKGKPVLKDINIDLEAGKVYHLEGVNGAGKSTLSRVLTGILKMQDKSQLLAQGKTVNPYKNPGRLIGYSFQNPDEQLFATTVFEEVLPGIYNTKEDKDRRDVLLATFGLQDIAKEHPREMPFVIRKRIALAATLAMDRPWYILDESTIGLDNDSVRQLADVLKKLLLVGKSFILISHAHILVSCLDTKSLYLENKNLHF